MKLTVTDEGNLFSVVFWTEITPGQLSVIRSILAPERFDSDGNRNPLWPQGVCGMWGHMERGCLTYERHMALCKEGVGFSDIPGPTDAEIDAEEAEMLRGR